MITFAFVNPKGGTGKTTSALLLAEQIALADAQVTILDCDPNQNILEWLTRRDEEGRPTPFKVLPRPPEDKLIQTVDALAEKTEYLILDLEGTASQSVTYALSRADLALIPLEPNAVEGPHAARAVSLIRRTGQMLNREIPYTLVLNRCNAAFETSEERALRREIQLVDVQALPVVLVRRTAFTKIFGEALMLSELQHTASGQRERDRFARALANARAYAHSVVDALREKAAA